jgi:hypothetical protein
MRIAKRLGLFSRSLTTALWLLLALLLGWWFLGGGHRKDAQLYSVTAPAECQWIAVAESAQYATCFRKDFQCGGEVLGAWLAVTSEGGYGLLCNGNPVGAQTYWRPTRNFQNGLTESGQRVMGGEPLVAYNFPREYQWSGHRNDKIVTYFDLGPYLKAGKNTLALDVEARIANPAVIAFGRVSLAGGLEIPLQTDVSWKAEPVPPELKQNDWSKPLHDVSRWRQAVPWERSRDFLTTVPPGMFEEALAMRWVLSGDESGGGEFVARFDQSDELSNLKILTQSSYWMWLNGQLIEPNRSSKKGYNGKEWDLAWEGRRPLATPPILLDPDETASFFGGERFADPRHGDPTENDFKRFENMQNRTRERPNQTGDFLLEDGDEERGRLQDPYGFFEEVETPVPHSLLRERNRPKLQGFAVGDLLKPSGNELRVRLVGDPGLGYQGSQSARFAVMSNELSWQEVTEEGEKEAQMGLDVRPQDLPEMEFMGQVAAAGDFWIVAVASLVLFLVFLVIGKRLSWLRTYAVVVSLLLLLTAIFQWSFEERSEIMWFLSPRWGVIAVIFAVLTPLFFKLFSWRKLKWSPRWTCFFLLLLVFFLRAWKVDFQPIDDDEYASIQAVLSIAETGKPQIADEIWYSRSPLYHYGAAVFVKLFGPNIWALRLYSVMLSVATGWLVWLLARRYLRDPWLAGLALAIFALHPFLIFSGHIARFYQQQQFMVLLMLHLFVQGFLVAKSVKHRVGAILVFAFAVLSQEISISFVPVFIILYLLFGRGVSFKWDFKSVLYIVFASILVVADIALFQVKCLTRSVGVSPNVEATLAPTFWELGNLTSMLLGYSRLHVVVSFFYFISLIYALRRGAPRLITLHLMLIISIVAFNLIITSVSFRYMYSIIPLWILLGAHGVGVFSEWTVSQTGRRSSYQIRWAAAVLILLSLAPWRTLASYDEKILGDPISALAYVRSELRDVDKIMITEPHPHAAKIEAGRVDYDLVVPILYDFTYNDNGVLRDRNGNAEVVNRMAQLQKIFATNERVWVIVNREKFRSRKKNIRWEYPGAREELFLRENCQLKFRSYLWSVFLWDRGSGELKSFRKESDAWVE